jgi:hypothetical protein
LRRTTTASSLVRGSGKDLAYPDFYTETVYDKLDDKETVNLGFRTTVESPSRSLSTSSAPRFATGELELNDLTTIREMLTYIVTDTGSMEAEEGCHDDTVTSLAIANHIHEGLFDARRLHGRFLHSGNLKHGYQAGRQRDSVAVEGRRSGGRQVQ